MPKEVMTRHAADNTYLHRDFHGALNLGIRYLRERFGHEAVVDYLRNFADSYYAPLKERLRNDDLDALAAHFRTTYEAEEAEAQITVTDDELLLRVPSCPAVAHIRSLGYEPDEDFIETTRAVNEALCDGTPFVAELVSYEPSTGASVQRFCRRSRP